MITAGQVNDFKEKYCDENTIIPIILRENFLQYVEFPLLDIGSGLGEISSIAFASCEVHHLDIEDFSFLKIDPNHTREIGDFYSFRPKKYYPTLLLSHTLQFIDEDIFKLNNRIKELNPNKIIIVRNTNKDFMGEIINYFDAKKIQSNPERIIQDFPIGYVLEKTFPFKATFNCSDFEMLSGQIAYLWDMHIGGTLKEDFVKFLQKSLKYPGFDINQEIILYTRDK